MKNKIITLLLLLTLLFSFTAYANDIRENNKRELLRYILINASNNAKHEIDSEELFLDTLMKVAGDSDEDYEQHSFLLEEEEEAAIFANTWVDGVAMPSVD